MFYVFVVIVFFHVCMAMVVAYPYLRRDIQNRAKLLFSLLTLFIIVVTIAYSVLEGVV